jgi:hypothetical protein
MSDYCLSRFITRESGNTPVQLVSGTTEVVKGRCLTRESWTCVANRVPPSLSCSLCTWTCGWRATLFATPAQSPRVKEKRLVLSPIHCDIACVDQILCGDFWTQVSSLGTAGLYQHCHMACVGPMRPVRTLLLASSGDKSLCQSMSFGGPAVRFTAVCVVIAIDMAL